MAIVEAIVYAVVQGVTELLPISSSGYTSLTAWALGWTAPPVSFVAAIHLGSMLALIAFFRRDWMFLLRAAMRRRRISLGGDDDLNALRQLELRRRIGDNRPRLGNRIAMPSRQLLLAALIGTLPTLAVGPILYPWLSNGSDLSAQVIGGMLVVSSGLLVAGHYFNFARVTGKDSRSRRSGITGIDAVFIGGRSSLSTHSGHLPLRRDHHRGVEPRLPCRRRSTLLFPVGDTRNRRRNGVCDRTHGSRVRFRRHRLGGIRDRHGDRVHHIVPRRSRLHARHSYARHRHSATVRCTDCDNGQHRDLRRLFRLTNGRYRAASPQSRVVTSASSEIESTPADDS